MCLNCACGEPNDRLLVLPALPHPVHAPPHQLAHLLAAPSGHSMTIPPPSCTLITGWRLP